MSILFHPLKALGLYSTNVPLLIKYVENDDFYLFSAVGCYFIVYRFSNLALVSTSDKLDEDILSIAGYKNTLFTGCQTKVYGFSQAKHVSKVYEYNNEKNWRIVVVLGEEGYVCGVNELNRLVMWYIDSGEVLCQFLFPSEREEFIIQTVMQPKNYGNKILVTSTNGKMHLINYMKNKFLYAFNLGKETVITCVAQTPNDDTIAIGCENGKLVLLNLLYDKQIMNIYQDLGPVTSIGFRTDIEDKLIMLAATRNGHVTMWDLNNQTIISQLMRCHDGAIATLFCVPGKPLLISNSIDNSIKVWNYDRPNGMPLLLRSRNGHWKPPTQIKFWPKGPLSNEIISTGGDSCMMVFNTFEDKYNFCMGRAYQRHHDNRREDRVTREQYVLPPSIDLSACSAREFCWDTVAVCHKSHQFVTTWSFNKRTRGKHYLQPDLLKQKHFMFYRSVATKCAISNCGDFVLVGYSSGHVVKFNIQSGIERGLYIANNGADGEDKLSRAHEYPISGLVIGQTEESTIAVSAAARQLSSWDFMSRKSISMIVFEADIASLTLHPSGDMVAVATVNGLVNLVQLNKFIIFQQLRVSFNAGPVAAIAFSYDFDLVMIADRNLVKTFDYINNRLVDCFQTRRPITHLEMAPNDAFLVSTHEDDLGLYLWSLKLHYINLKLSRLPFDYQPAKTLDAPKVYCVDDENDEDDVKDSCEMFEVECAAANSPHAALLARLSSLPQSYFTSLLNVESIRIRNEKATKGLASTEFFLPQVKETLNGLRWLDEDESESANVEEDDKEKFSRMKETQANKKRTELADSKKTLTDNFSEMLIRAQSEDDYDRCIELLKSISPSSLDYEIQMLDPIYHETRYEPLKAFLRLLNNQMERLNNVEFCQMCLNCLLKHNIDCLIDDPTTEMARADIVTPNNTDEQMPDIADALLVADSLDCDRVETLGLVSSVVNTMHRSCSQLTRNLTQIIEMAGFIKKSL